ncbi:MAG: heavy metal-associated domain-containing protein [Bryobacteraceae bacterium]
MRIPLLCLVAVLSARAEFRSIEMGVSGLDCASCAGSVERVLRKIRGVESASFDNEKRVARLELAAGNRARLQDIRDALKQIGYTPVEARGIAIGSVASEGGRWRLDLGGGRFCLLEGGDAARWSGKTVRVEGAIPPPAAPGEPDVLRIGTIQAE